MEEDLKIICKQTNLKYEEAKKIYEKNENDITRTICEIEGFNEEVKEKVVLTEAQEKIKELREIVENKDQIMDSKKDNV